MYHVFSKDLIVEAFGNARIGNRESIGTLLKEFFSKKDIKKDDISGSAGVLVNSPEITSSLILEIFDCFERAIYNYYAQYTLAEKGYYTWAQVTNYYSNFFSAHALLKLQGRCITNIWRSIKPDGNIAGQFFHIFPYDIKKNKFVVCTNFVKGKSNHIATWKLYYEIYDRFKFPTPQFERVYKRRYTENNGFDEINFRNERNYRPFESFEEIWDPSKLESIVTNYITGNKSDTNDLDTLESLTTDPDFKYFARSALRILFTYDMIRAIVDKNPKINKFWNERKIALNTFAKFVMPSSSDGTIIEKFPSLIFQ